MKTSNFDIAMAAIERHLHERECADRGYHIKRDDPQHSADLERLRRVEHEANIWSANAKRNGGA